MTYPLMHTATVRFSRDHVGDVEAAVRQALEGADLEVAEGARIAITAGSRGIAALPAVIRTIVAVLRERGAEPFLVPAMGSHGGATAKGQDAVLRKLQLGKRDTGAPIVSSMETVNVGKTKWGTPVLLDKRAMESDGIIVLGRVKEHTNYNGRHESGLLKMLGVGLGKKDGADAFHELTMHHGYEEALLETARVALVRCPVLLGMGLVENAYGQLARIEACGPRDFITTDARLLEYSRKIKPRLPVSDIDLLIVDELGKDISGTGMDTKVIGRIYHYGQEEPKSPRIKRIFVRGLTDATGGNANGIGMADFTTRAVIDQMDRRMTYLNSMTANHPEMARLPLYFETEKEAVDAALTTVGCADPNEARIVWIRNTRDLLEIHVSANIVRELRQHRNVEVDEEGFPLSFDFTGTLRKD